MRKLVLLCSLFSAITLQARGDEIRWNGFVFARGLSAPSTGPLAAKDYDSQLHLGLDWNFSPVLLVHVQLLARTDSDEHARRGNAGVVEAYLEANVHRMSDRFRLRAGAFFLPTSRENVDALWEPAYSLTPSALNSWLGEEFRPIGIDATWFHRSAFAGATLFRGNDTFGALPPVRGWRLHDQWILLGEHLAVDDEYYTSVSAETDGSLGWSARAGWNGPHLMVQMTHIDNRSDALEHGELVNWNTRFEIAAIEYSTDVWTVALESGWGPTVVIDEEDGRAFETPLRATYLLASRQLGKSRLTLRADRFSAGSPAEDAFTVAWLWSPRGPIRTGLEVIHSEGENRVAAEIRYNFSSR